MPSVVFCLPKPLLLSKIVAIMAQQILLEIDSLKMLRHRRRWNLYFLVATGDPEDTSKMAITTLSGFDANNPITLRPPAHNEIHFAPENQAGASGLIAMQRAMPADYSVQCRLWLMQTRSEIVEVGHILKSISTYLEGSEVIQDVEKLMGVANQWVFAGKAINKGIGGVSEAISKLKDRNLGFINMDEHFGPEILKTGEIDLHNTLSSGYAELSWTWSVFSPPTQA